MKPLILGMLIAGVVWSGCAKIVIDEKQGIASYTRFGNQELNKVVINLEKTSEGMKLESSLGGQKSDREIAEVLLSLSENIDKALQILLELERRFP